MLFYIGLGFIATLQVIELQLDVFRTRLEGTNVDNFFEVEGLRVDNSEYLVAMTQLTFTEAMIYCKRSNAQLNIHLDRGNPSEEYSTVFL